MKEHNLNTVLLIEDDKLTGLIATILLKRAGVSKTDIVGDGQEALAYLEQKKPDLIFLDLSMPEMTGFEFLELARKEGLCMDIPIIILTSSIRLTDREKGLKFNHIVDYITKPLSPQKLEMALVKL